MTYRSLLVHLDGDAHCAVRIDAAIRLAARHECHLVGVAATGSLNIPVMPDAVGQQAELQALAWDSLRDQAEAAAERFREACGAQHFKSFEVVVDERDKAASIVERAHCSDLVLLSQPEPAAAWPGSGPGFVHEVVLNSARPTLVLPYTARAGALDPAAPALIAWDDSREASRAVSDALPLLQRCRSVQVVTWKERSGDNDAALNRRLQALRQWLLWHGVPAEAAIERSGMGVAEALLSRAADLGSGLVVMGAYGHTRLSERILGGATRGLLEAMTVPVLMSH